MQLREMSNLLFISCCRRELNHFHCFCECDRVVVAQATWRPSFAVYFHIDMYCDLIVMSVFVSGENITAVMVFACLRDYYRCEMCVRLCVRVSERERVMVVHVFCSMSVCILYLSVLLDVCLCVCVCVSAFLP